MRKNSEKKIGIDREKIFVLKGAAETVNKIREEFDKGKQINLDDQQDPYIVADLLKLFLRGMFFGGTSR